MHLPVARKIEAGVRLSNKIRRVGFGLRKIRGWVRDATDVTEQGFTGRQKSGSGSGATVMVENQKSQSSATASVFVYDRCC